MLVAPEGVRALVKIEDSNTISGYFNVRRDDDGGGRVKNFRDDPPSYRGSGHVI